jgi:hypothetical protein
LDLLAGDDLAWALKKHAEDLKRLLLEFEFDSTFAEFTALQVQLKDTELMGRPLLFGVDHGKPRLKRS